MVVLLKGLFNHSVHAKSSADGGANVGPLQPVAGLASVFALAAEVAHHGAAGGANGTAGSSDRGQARKAGAGKVKSLEVQEQQQKIKQ